MPRKKITRKKEVIVDPVYNSTLIAKLINGILQAGKKNLAQNIMYGAMDMIQEKIKEDPFKVVTKALENIKPQIETRSRRVGGATYQVPMEVRRERAYSLAIRWLIDNARSRPGHSFKEKLVGELLDAYALKGGAMKKREVVQKMAESNRAFAHYKW